MRAILRFLRLLIALMIAQVLVALVALFLLGTLITAQQAPPLLEHNTLLRVTLSGEIIEYSTLPEVPLLRQRVLTQTDILEALRDAAVDDHVEAVLVDLDTPLIGWGKAFELHQAILQFRESGKPAWGWGTSMEEIDLYIGAACDSLFAPPSGLVLTNGFGIGGTYVNRTLDLLGIRPNFLRTGDYKSAPEMFTEEGMSPAARRENEWLLQDMWNEFVDTVLARRGLDGPEFSAILRKGLFTSREAVDAGLIDGVRHLEQIMSQYTDDEGKAQWVGVLTYRKEHEREAVKRGDIIAVIHARGLILRGPHGYHPNFGAILGASSVIEDIEDALHDDDVVAIVLRIDSGGGDLVASDMIRHAVERARERKPIVVSMVDVAASGGYMMAYPATRLFAMPGTITGSIGAYIGKFNLLGLYDKIGVSKDFVTRGEYPLLWSDYQDWSAREESLIARHLWTNYDEWTADIAELRNLRPADVDSIGRGRVWTGRQAFQNGLVDDIGTLQDAVNATRRLAGIEADEPTYMVHYPRPRSWIDLLFSDEEIVLGALQERLQGHRALPRDRVWSRLDLQTMR
jgi:protease-4